LERDAAFPESVRQVSILCDGDRRVIIPADRLWDDFFDAPGIDIGERDQPTAETRGAF
jgi:antitoxin VapB